MSEKINIFKRKRGPQDPDTEVSIKRRCINDTEQTVSGTKNLANNRLKKLKDNIQAELKSRNTSNSHHNVSPEVLPYKSFTSNLNENISRKSASPEKKGTQKRLRITSYTDNEKTVTLGLTAQITKKNIANERLQKIKRSLNSLDSDSTYVKASNVDDENLSDSLKQSKIASTDFENYGFKMIKREDAVCKKSSLSSRLTPIHDKGVKNIADESRNSSIHNTEVDCNRMVNSDNFIALKQNVNTFSNFDPNTSIPQEHSKINCDIEYHINDNYMKSSAVSPRISSNETSTKVPETVSPCQGNIAHSSSLPSESNSFVNKEAITSSWVNDHHQGPCHEDNSLLSYSGNSLSVNIDDSTAKINFDETEDMEWINAEPDDNTAASTNVPQKHIDENKSKDLCIVVDTNVFISALSKVRDIMNMTVTGPSQPVILIPWMVMTELDYMKHSSSDVKLKKNVTNSIAYINNMLEQKHPRLLGQTVHEVEIQKDIGKSPDDKIIACCLQVVEKYEKVILASNDVNLKSKAMIHNIPACSTNEIVMKVTSTLSKTTKTKKIIHKMGILCSTIICECAKEAYGDVWIRMDMLNSPPWSLENCLKRFKKYWNSIFSEKLLKQAKPCIEKLLTFLESHKCICDDSEEFIKMMELCIYFCIFLKDLEDFKPLVDNVLNEIKKL